MRLIMQSVTKLAEKTNNINKTLQRKSKKELALQF